MQKKIPRLELNVAYILARADNRRDLFSYPSDIYGAGHVTDGREILVITSCRGYLRLTHKQAKILIDELKNIMEDNERFR